MKTIALLAASVTALMTVHIPVAGALTISGTFIEDTLTVNCAGASRCDLNFSTLPSTLAGQFVTFTEVSCAADTDTGLSTARLLITDNLSNPRRPHFFNIERSPGPVTFWNALTVKVSGGPPRQMVIILHRQSGAGTTFNATCTLAGTISAQ